MDYVVVDGEIYNVDDPEQSYLARQEMRAQSLESLPVFRCEDEHFEDQIKTTQRLYAGKE